MNNFNNCFIGNVSSVQKLLLGSKIGFTSWPINSPPTVHPLTFLFYCVCDIYSIYLHTSKFIDLNKELFDVILF
jgi:hypothetical protein